MPLIYQSGYRGGLDLGGGYENVSKDNWGYEIFWKICEHCGVKSCTYFSMGYENFSTRIAGGQNC